MGVSEFGSLIVVIFSIINCSTWVSIKFGFERILLDFIDDAFRYLIQVEFIHYVSQLFLLRITIQL